MKIYRLIAGLFGLLTLASCGLDQLTHDPDLALTDPNARTALEEAAQIVMSGDYEAILEIGYPDPNGGPSIAREPYEDMIALLPDGELTADLFYSERRLAVVDDEDISAFLPNSISQAPRARMRFYKSSSFHSKVNAAL